MTLKRIFTTGERAVYQIVQSVAGFNDVEVLAKVRIADAVEIERSGISDHEYSFALKGHFDVLAVRNNLPILAIEFDGPGHDPRNDAVKNGLADRFNLPLVRVTIEHLNATTLGDSAVHFLVHQLFGVEAFEQKYRSDPYEIYDPIFFAAVPGKRETYPFAYAARWRKRLESRFKQNTQRFAQDVRELYKHGLLQFGSMEGVWSKGQETRAVCAQSVGNDFYVLGQARLRLTVFGMAVQRRENFLRVHPFVVGLAAEEMFENAVNYLAGDDARAVAVTDLRRVPEQWAREGFQFQMGLGRWQ